MASGLDAHLLASGPAALPEEVGSMSDNAILPWIRTLPLPDDETKILFSRVIRLVQLRSGEFLPAGQWLDRHYSEQALYERMLPEKEREWDWEQRDLTAAPTKEELDGLATGQSWHSQRAGTWKEHCQQHREARALKHPKYKLAMADRRTRLGSLKKQRRDWRPSQTIRLTRAVSEVIDVKHPDPPEHIEHSRRIAAIAALLV